MTADHLFRAIATLLAIDDASTFRIEPLDVDEFAIVATLHSNTIKDALPSRLEAFRSFGWVLGDPSTELGSYGLFHARLTVTP